MAQHYLHLKYGSHKELVVQRDQTIHSKAHRNENDGS